MKQENSYLFYQLKKFIFFLFQNNHDTQEQEENASRSQTQFFGTVPTKQTEQAQKIAQSTPIDSKGVITAQNQITNINKTDDGDKTVNGDLKSERNDVKTVINNSVPCTKNVSNVFSERKDIELASKTPAHLNPAGEYYEHILNSDLFVSLWPNRQLF